MKAILADQIKKKIPARRFVMPYQITCAVFKSFDEDFQNLAVGLVDGAIIIIDLILGIEKHFLEKHPSAITTMAFFEDKCLMSGSVCGRVNVADIFNMDKKRGGNRSKMRFLKCQNCQDRKIPVVRIDTSPEFGLGYAIDIEGNCRFYDLFRYKKLAKISPHLPKSDDQKHSQTHFRIMLSSCMEMMSDSFLAVLQTEKIHRHDGPEPLEKAPPV
mmetsp:Transcript_18573/g.31770  ORF Transcript_18573/g.31770 Transcript_18573/m.31770 type:complete len:215 (-) Transcript_18573:868-1512(-)